MFVFISSTIVLLVATIMISKRFGLWAGLGVIGTPAIMNAIDFFVVGDLTVLRQQFFALWGFLAIVACFKASDYINRRSKK